jgi:hypothetical protein
MELFSTSPGSASQKIPIITVANIYNFLFSPLNDNFDILLELLLLLLFG